MMRIGILGHGFVGWGGGLDFLRIVASSLHATGAPLEFHVLLPVEGPLLAVRRRIARLRSVMRRSSNATEGPADLSATRIDEAMASFGVPLRSHRIDIGPRAIERAHRRLALDILLPSITALPFGRGTPWVGYLYDFQHLHLPQFFAPREIADRNRAFARVLEDAPAIVVNSRSVAADASAFSAQATGKVFALPFSAAPLAEWLSPHSESVVKRYGITKPYFIICNQFWKHKDHATAFSAFARLAESYSNVDLVCTGSAGDYRDAEHFPRLQRALIRDGIADRVRILGMVPKADQIALLRGAITLVQPTLFEGGPGGGAVYDAVSLDVPSLVSDIPVNLELDEPTVSFFRAGDAEDLALHMGRVLTTERRSIRSGQQLLTLGHERRQRCGEVLLRAIELARR